MIYVLLSVACSVLVSVLLKLARRFEVDVGQAIAWNYVVTSALTALLLQPTLASLREPGVPWLALAALGLLALLCMVWRSGHGTTERGAAGWLYPLLVFGGFGAIDILFKRVALAGVPLGASLQAMFALALLVAFAMQLWRRVQGQTRFTTRSALAGLLLGLANFGNILFYLRGHRALPQHPSLVFASMNLGVVALGALVGLLVFRERLSRFNLAGVALALVAIGVIARG
jgi:drug/metabolite transporter (DMT)-like permease